MTGNNTLADGDVKSKTRLPFKQIFWFQLFALIIFAAGLAGGICVGIFVYHDGPNNHYDSKHCFKNCLDMCQVNKEIPLGTETVGSQRICSQTEPVTTRRYEDSIYAPLSTEEMEKAAKFLLREKIISTLEKPTSLTENFLLYQWLDGPVKTDALKFLDNDGAKPKRYARASVQRGGVPSPDVMEYRIGPLDGGIMTAKPLTQPGDIHFNTRPYEMLELGIARKMLQPELDILAPLLAESFDGARHPRDTNINFFNGPPSTSGTERNVRWNLAFKGFGRQEGGDLIHILPVSGTIHCPGTDITQWHTDDFHYLNQGPFDNATQLMNAYNRGEVRKVKFDKGFRNTIWDRIFPKRDTKMPFRENADVHGPRTYYPAGPRYTVDGTHVKWMGWSFDISGGQIRGPALFNIRFNNERIVYELAVNDIALNYAMDSHSQNNIIFADATYGIMGGVTASTLIKGVDCPEHGTVLETAFWWHITQRAVNMTSICIFEADGQEPLWRHAGRTFEAGLRNRYLVVRVPVVIGNYDYTFEFNFFLDGKIYTFAKASGYIQASFWDEGNPMWPDKTRDPFGYRIADQMTGPIHDHMFGFKVDMDVIDRNNTFQVIKWKAGPQLEAIQTQNANITKKPGYFIYDETRFIEWEKIEKEIGIKAGDSQDQQFWLVVNEHEKNKWGVERGYQIAPLETGSQSLKQHPLLKALSFTKYHCAVTKRKEEEQTLTSIYDVNRMDYPQHYLDSFIDGEDIRNEDIVNWVTVGFLHIPTSEDMPMTARVQTGFLIKPFNFFDRTASFDMPQHTETLDNTLTESEPVYSQCVEPKLKYCRFC